MEKKEAKNRIYTRRPSEPQWKLTDFSFDDFKGWKSGFMDRNRTTKIKSRSIVEEYQTTKTDSREFLKLQYSDERQRLVCQICQEEMPFQTYDGEFYYEAVKIVERTTLDNIANYLCCCPNCAAMYRYANKNKDDMPTLISEAESSDNATYLLTLELANSDCEIRFTEKHFNELVGFLDRQTQH